MTREMGQVQAVCDQNGQEGPGGGFHLFGLSVWLAVACGDICDNKPGTQSGHVVRMDVMSTQVPDPDERLAFIRSLDHAFND
jgi:hypothetical protein